MLLGDSCRRRFGSVTLAGGIGDTEGVPQLLVQPNGPLSGQVRVGGAKNSVLKLMAAAILAEGRTVLTNVPEIRDVEIMAEMLEALGLSVSRLEDRSLEIVTPPTSGIHPEAPLYYFQKMLNMARDSGKSIAELVMANELVHRTQVWTRVYVDWNMFSYINHASSVSHFPTI